MKKGNMLWNIILAAIWLLQVTVEGFTLAIILRLGMLPDKYLAILIGLLVFLALLTGFMMFLHRKGKKVGDVRRILACILALLIVIGCAAVFFVVNELYRTVDNITTPSTGGMTRSVFVRMEDPAGTLEDAADYTFGIVENYDTESTEQAIMAIEAELQKKITIVSFATVPEMIDALYSGRIGAMILNDAYAQILEEDENYADFLQKVRVLRDVPVAGWTEPTTEPTTEPPTETTEPETTEATQEPPNITNTPFIVYISGSDTRNQSLPKKSRSDVNILAVVNPATKQVLLINTPRDYYVTNPAGGGNLDKLTHCGVYGIDYSIEALESLYAADIDYYAKINFTGFETLIDAIGGITVYSDVAFTATYEHEIKVGENHLNGEQALAFARERYSLAGGDNARGKNQMKVIKAVIEKMTSGTTIISRYSQILDSLQGMFVMDMPMEDVGLLVKMQLDDMAQWNIVTYSATGKGGRDVTYSAPGQKLYVMYPNADSVNYARELIRQVLAGEILMAN